MVISIEIILALIAVSGVVWSAYINHASARTNAAAHINASVLETLSKRVESLEAKVTVMYDIRDKNATTIRVLTDYAIKLRQWIIDGKEPPPPEWPPEI